jgi:hypothetical protein
MINTNAHRGLNLYEVGQVDGITQLVELQHQQKLFKNLTFKESLAQAFELLGYDQELIEKILAEH